MGKRGLRVETNNLKPLKSPGTITKTWRRSSLTQRWKTESRPYASDGWVFIKFGIALFRYNLSAVIANFNFLKLGVLSIVSTTDLGSKQVSYGVCDIG